MKIEELTENDVIHIRNKKEAKGISKLSNRNVKDLFDDYGKYSGYFHIAKAVEDIRECGGYNIIPASKFLKPSLKKKVKELEKWREDMDKIKEYPNATNIEVHFDEVEKLPEKWALKLTEDMRETVNKWLKWTHGIVFIDGWLHYDKVIRSGQWYTEISFETFKKLVLKEDEKPVELETGKWYKDTRENSKSLYFIQSIVSPVGHADLTISSYGITMTGEWSDLCLRNKNVLGKYFRPTTDEEVKEALIKFCQQYYDGKIIKCLHGVDNMSIADVKRWEWDGVCLRYHDNKGNLGCVFDKSAPVKWATIIEPEIDFSKAGQLVVSTDDKVLVLTLPHKRDVQGTFTGIVLSYNGAEDKGDISDDWATDEFTLYKDELTLSN